MPLYDVQQYETHITTIRVTADDPASGVEKVLVGEGEVNNFEFAGIAYDHGCPSTKTKIWRTNYSTGASSKTDD